MKRIVPPLGHDIDGGLLVSVHLMPTIIVLPLKSKPTFRHAGVSQMEVESVIREIGPALDGKASLGTGIEYFSR